MTCRTIIASIQNEPALISLDSHLPRLATSLLISDQLIRSSILYVIPQLKYKKLGEKTREERRKRSNIL